METVTKEYSQQLLEQIRDQLATLAAAIASPQPQAGPLLTEKEAANYLAVKPQTLAVWRSAAKGPAYIKVGTSVRYLMDSLTAYVRRQEVPR